MLDLSHANAMHRVTPPTNLYTSPHDAAAEAMLGRLTPRLAAFVRAFAAGAANASNAPATIVLGMVPKIINMGVSDNEISRITGLGHGTIAGHYRRAKRLIESELAAGRLAPTDLHEAPRANALR